MCMGFFDTVFGVAEAFGELGKDLANLAKDSSQEFGEIMTDGFKEMVIKGNNNYKTSFEVEEEANRKINSANRRYNSAQNDLEKCISSTEDTLVELGKLKIKIQTETIDNWLKYFRKYQLTKYETKIFKKYENLTNLKYDNLYKIESQSIDIKNTLFNRVLGRPELISMGNLSLSLGLRSIIGIQGKVLNMVTFNPLMLGMGLAIDPTRKSRANEYLNDAKDYSKDVDLHISKINQAKMAVEIIKKNSETIIKELNILNEYLIKMIVDFSRFDSKINQSKENELISSIYVVQGINALSSIEVMNKDGYPNDKIQNLLNQTSKIIDVIKNQL